MTLTTGQVLQSRYRIVSMLGQGGMGAVFRAWDTRLSISVALKEMMPQPGLDHQMLAGLRQQFQREAQILARLSHPHLVRVGDFFDEGGNAYLVMDFVEGESLAGRIARQGAVPEAQVLTWATQLLDALAYCHSQGVIHRDIKPQNVIIRHDEQAVLVDFGLVKLWNPYDPQTRTAMRGMGTPEYAPPEQYDATMGHTDPRSDVYSLGATIYHTLTGHAPPTATMRTANPGRFQPPRVLNPYVSPRTEAVVLRATELAVENRFATVQEMAAVLSGQAPMPVQPVAPPYQPATEPQPATGRPAATTVAGAQPVAPAQRKRTPVWAWVLGGLAALLLVVGVSAAALVAMSNVALRAPTPQVDERTTAAARAETENTRTPSPSPSSTPAATGTPESSPTSMPSVTPTASPRVETPTPTSSPSPTPTPTPLPQPTTPPPSDALITFERWGTWETGDQPYGELTQTREQVHTGSYAAELRYDFPNTEEDFVVFAHPVGLEGQPDTVSVWVYGDGSGHYLNIWVEDAKEEMWSVHLGEVGGKGWKKLVGSIDPSRPSPSGHISGPDNGLVDYPIRFHALVLDRPGSGPRSGHIYVDDISVWQTEREPTATPVPRPTATPMPRPTATPGRVEPTPTPTSESPVSEGPLGFPVPTRLDGWTPVEGGHRAEIYLQISGGAPPFKVYHDATFMGETQERFFNLTFVASGCTLVHSITVESADGQSVAHDYYIVPPGCE